MPRLHRPPSSTCPTGGSTAASASYRRGDWPASAARSAALMSGDSGPPGDLNPKGMWPELRLVEPRHHFPAPRHRIDALAVLGRDLDIDCLEVVLQLLHRARADDRAGHARLLHAPRQGELGQRHTLVFGDRRQPIDHVENAVRPAALLDRVRRHCPESRVRRRWLVAMILAGQQAAREWAPRDDAEAIGLRHGDEFAFDSAVEQVVWWLLADEAVEVVLLRNPERFHELPRAVGAGADVSHLAGTHEVIHRAQSFVDRDLGLGAM